MRQWLVNHLVRFHKRPHSPAGKIISLACGGIFFLLILPAAFMGIGLWAETFLSFGLSRGLEYAIAVAALIPCLWILAWTALVQWKTGKGTPLPSAPTQQLVISGPYRLCRNPIELGAILYYLGMGILCGGLPTGLACFALGLAVGSAYHKFVEEKELEIRFGEAYRAYRRSTPFLFPRIRIRIRNRHREERGMR